MSSGLFLKKMLSYFIDINLEKNSSSYNPVLQVSLSRGRYRLDTQNATYSFEEFYRNYFNAFDTLQLPSNSFQNVLVLGAGLGSIPLMLEKYFNQNAQYTLVEIDEKVIELAQKYLPKELSSKINFVCADAHDFVMKQKQVNKFDLIAHDVFIDDITDEKFREASFLQTLKAHLSPKQSFLLYNTLQDKRTDAFWQTFQQVFPDAHMISIPGNDMLVGQV